MMLWHNCFKLCGCSYSKKLFQNNTQYKGVEYPIVEISFFMPLYPTDIKFVDNHAIKLIENNCLFKLHLILPMLQMILTAFIVLTIQLRY